LLPDLSCYIDSAVKIKLNNDNNIELSDEDINKLTTQSPFLENLKSIIIDLMLTERNDDENGEDDLFVLILFKLCAEIRPLLLNDVNFLSKLSIKSCIKNVNILSDLNFHHAVGLIYYLNDQNEEAFQLWTQLCDDGDKKSDPNFPGFDFIVNHLKKLADHKLVWKYVDWCMRKDQIKAVEIFTKRNDEEEEHLDTMRLEKIVEYLQEYDEALRIYLEYLILHKKIKVKKPFLFSFSIQEFKNY
jgi:hypothetical protein